MGILTICAIICALSQVNFDIHCCPLIVCDFQYWTWLFRWVNAIEESSVLIAGILWRVVSGCLFLLHILVDDIGMLSATIRLFCSLHSPYRGYRNIDSRLFCAYELVWSLIILKIIRNKMICLFKKNLHNLASASLK